MINADVQNFLLSPSMISYFLNLLHVVRKVIYLALGCNPSSSSSSSSWTLLLPKAISLASKSKHASAKNTRQGLSLVLEEEYLTKEREVEEVVVGGISLDSEECPHENSQVKVGGKMRRRPANLKLVVPEIFSELEMEEEVKEPSQREFEMEGKDYFMASRRGGRRHVMEDDFDVISDVMGDSNKAFFGVYDGHGGRAAVDFVAQNLGKKIVMALREVEEGNEQSKEAIKKGYMVTDQEFLSQDVGSGACAATVLVKDGALYVANVGDCRVVLSRKGVATALTSDQRVDREDERMRVESLGGYVDCQRGVWRVQGSLAVSRAIGDLHFKPLVISEPEIKKIEITSDCEFLVIASDGLWDKVSNQEAVDMVLRHKNSIESCRKLVDISCSRGNKDDITVMVVDLQNFKTQS